ncbi:MAG: alpha/beta hydrolase [Clostridia bacterium]|nr:alpha/beta hydrolase [Clostridia bacterium]
MLWLYILIGVAALFLLLEAAIAVYFFNFAIKPHPYDPYKKHDQHPELDMDAELKTYNDAKKGLLSYEYDTIQLISRDGLKLNGRYYHAKASRGITVIMMHGYNNNWFYQFGYDALYYLEHGCDVLLPDQRACGESEGKYITFGVYESEDCADWCYRVNEEYSPSYIILHGISLGGATVCCAAGEKMPGNVAGIIEDCGFTSPYEQFVHNLKPMKLPPALVLPVTEMLCRMKAGFGFRQKCAVDEIKKNKLPLLVIHGAEDTFVPTWMGKKIYEAAECDKELLLVDGADHAMAYRIDGEKCRTAAARLIYKATGIDITV